jgi:hypothetical protein
VFAESRWFVRHAWWLSVELGALGVLAVLLVTAARQPAPLTDAQLRAQLADRVVTALEHASPTDHHDHGHEIRADDRVACVAEVLGFEPPSANRLADVRVVYAQYLCASGVPGTAFELSARSAGPVVVRLTTKVPTVRVPHGQGYAEQVRQMLPDQYEEQAFAGFRDPAVPDALRARFQARMAGSLPTDWRVSQD